LNFRIPPFHWWRTVFFLIPAIALYTIVLGTISVLSSVFDNGYFAHRCARMWSRLILLTTGVTVGVTGLERLDPNGTYVFVSNHQSIYDIPVLFWSLPQQLRIIAKQSLGRFPFIGWHLRRTGHLLVDRSRPDRHKLFAWAKRLTEHRLSLFFFPEGTRSRDGRVGPFKTGSFYLALEAGLTIVPLSIVGSRHVMMKGRLATYPGHVRLVVHDPIETAGFSGRDRREFAERVRQIIVPIAESDRDVMPPDTHSDASPRDEVVHDAHGVAPHL
jgi:1-acyl-sn-glycerol-3-phosphate acyltransferase